MRPDQAAGGLRWLLTVDSLGDTWRWSTTPIEATDSRTGRTYAYDGGLPGIEVEIAVSPDATVGDTSPVTIEVPWPEAATLIARGHALRGRGELALWADGVDHAERLVVVVGRLVLGGSASADEPVTITIQPEIGTDGALVPDPDHIVDSEAWPIDGSTSPAGALPSDIGRAYPLVLGAPGPYRVIDPGSAAYGAFLLAPGSRALGARCSITVSAGGDDEYRVLELLVADGHVAAAEVSILYAPADSAGASAAQGLYEITGITVTNTTDALGRPVALADISGESAAVRGATEFYACWGDNSDRAYAIRGLDGQPIAGVGAAARWLLDRSTIEHDRAAWLGAEPHLDGWRVDLALADPESPWAVLVERLLPGLPVSVVPTPSGVAPVIWRPDLGRDHAIDHLVVGDGVWSESDMEGHDQATERVVVGLAVDAADDSPRQEVSLAPVADIDAHEGGVIWLRRSVDLVGGAGGRVDAIAETHERGTAYAVAAWLAALAAGWRTVTVGVGTDRIHLRLGDPVLFTHAERGLVAVPCQVAGITYRETGSLGLSLVLWAWAEVSSASIPYDVEVVEPGN